jgi:hypothetical protein
MSRGGGVTLQPYFSDADVTVYHGDCVDVLREMPDASVDSVVCDPPYALEFMGKQWDGWATPKAFQAWCGEWATECLRVLKPGGHLLAFGGSRTWHRLAAAVEDSGFELRDSIAWLYGSGFPKSLDVSKAIDKQRDDRDDVLVVTEFLADHAEAQGISRSDIDNHMGTSDMGGWWLSRLRHRCALPKWDQWLQIKEFMQLPDDMDAEVWRLNGRKGSPGEAWGERPDAGYISRPGMAESWTDGTGWTGTAAKGGSGVTNAAKQWEGWGTALKPAFEPIVVARKPLVGTVAQNVTQYRTGALNIDGCRISHHDDLSRYERSATSGFKNGGIYGGGERALTPASPAGRWPTNVVLDEAAAAELDQQSGTLASGKMRAGTERSNREGWAGPMPTQTAADTYGDSGGASRFFPVFKYTAKAGSDERPEVNGVRHPTVKPVSLISWLCRLVTPPGGTVLDPFAGSGTTAEACVLEHFKCITIEREADYLPLIVARLTKPIEVGFDFGEAA